MGKILIVDDDMEFLRMIELLFKLNAFDTDVASSGQMAIEKMTSTPYDLVLLDVMMPGMSGFEVCKTIREQLGLTRVPVIFLTAKGEKEDVIEGISTGANDYITKPFEAEILIAKVRGFLEHKRISDELEQKNELLKSLAITDDLTGAYNHRYFVQKLDEEFARSKRLGLHLSLIMCDLDHFKRVNDTYGHLVGDAVLRELARIVMDNIRKYDTFARYGGEEFALILPQADGPAAVREADRLRRLVSVTPFEHMPCCGEITISCGVAVFPNHDILKAEDMVRLADSALYEAKNGGRNRVVLHGEAAAS